LYLQYLTTMSLVNLRFLQHRMLRFSVNIESKMRCENASRHNLRYYACPFLGKLKRATKTSFYTLFIHGEDLLLRENSPFGEKFMQILWLGFHKIQASKNRIFCTDLLSDNNIIFCLYYAMNKGSIIINIRQLLYVILWPHLQVL